MDVAQQYGRLVGWPVGSLLIGSLLVGSMVVGWLGGWLAGWSCRSACDGQLDGDDGGYPVMMDSLLECSVQSMFAFDGESTLLIAM